MSITYDEIAELLAFCAVHDRRKGDDLDVQAWLMTATDQGWTASAALRVAREHYGAGADRPRLEPAAITDRIREIRRRAAATFELPRLPDDLPTVDYPAWLRRRRDTHVDALVHRWATTGAEPPAQIPPGPRPSEVGQRRIAELTAGAFARVPPAGLDQTPPTVERQAALAVGCPYCEARPHEPCTRPGAAGRVRIANPHPARVGDGSREAS